jgi:hypothetical protein
MNSGPVACITHGSGVAVSSEDINVKRRKKSGTIRPWILCIREIDNTNHGKARHKPGIHSPRQR